MAKSSKKSTTPVDSALQGLERRHRALLAELADVGLVLRGSIGERLTRCGNPACRCRSDPPMLHGPYYIWTRKVAGKTVTVQLKPEYAERCLDWNRNMHKLDRIVRELQAIGLQAVTVLRDG